MFNLLALVFVTVPLSSDADVCKTYECQNQEAISRIYKQLKKHGAKDMVNPKELAPAILYMAQYYDVDYTTITQVILVESRGREGAFNKRTKDYGLMQVNAHTAKAYEADTGCLFNWRCNLRLGVEILSVAKRLCHYNLGPRHLTVTRMRKCLIYERKIASVK